MECLKTIHLTFRNCFKAKSGFCVGKCVVEWNEILPGSCIFFFLTLRYLLGLNWTLAILGGGDGNWIKPFLSKLTEMPPLYYEDLAVWIDAYLITSELVPHKAKKWTEEAYSGDVWHVRIRKPIQYFGLRDDIWSKVLICYPNFISVLHSVSFCTALSLLPIGQGSWEPAVFSLFLFSSFCFLSLWCSWAWTALDLSVEKVWHLLSFSPAHTIELDVDNSVLHCSLAGRSVVKNKSLQCKLIEVWSKVSSLVAETQKQKLVCTQGRGRVLFTENRQTYLPVFMLGWCYVLDRIGFSRVECSGLSDLGACEMLLAPTCPASCIMKPAGIMKPARLIIDNRRLLWSSVCSGRQKQKCYDIVFLT